MVVLIALMVICAWIPSFDTQANEQVEAGLKRAVATYATARVLNGVISVVPINRDVNLALARNHRRVI